MFAHPVRAAGEKCLVVLLEHQIETLHRLMGGCCWVAHCDQSVEAAMGESTGAFGHEITSLQPAAPRHRLVTLV